MLNDWSLVAMKMKARIYRGGKGSTSINSVVMMSYIIVILKLIHKESRGARVTHIRSI